MARGGDDEILAPLIELCGPDASERKDVARDRLIGAACGLNTVCARWRLNLPDFTERSDDRSGVRVGAVEQQRSIDVKEQQQFGA